MRFKIHPINGKLADLCLHFALFIADKGPAASRRGLAPHLDGVRMFYLIVAIVLVRKDLYNF